MIMFRAVFRVTVNLIKANNSWTNENSDQNDVMTEPEMYRKKLELRIHLNVSLEIALTCEVVIFVSFLNLTEVL